MKVKLQIIVQLVEVALVILLSEGSRLALHTSRCIDSFHAWLASASTSLGTRLFLHIFECFVFGHLIVHITLCHSWKFPSAIVPAHPALFACWNSHRAHRSILLVKHQSLKALEQRGLLNRS